MFYAKLPAKQPSKKWSNENNGQLSTIVTFPLIDPFSLVGLYIHKKL